MSSTSSAELKVSSRSLVLQVTSINAVWPDMDDMLCVMLYGTIWFIYK